MTRGDGEALCRKVWRGFKVAELMEMVKEYDFGYAQLASLCSLTRV